jgi:hypothetical protein
MNMVGNALASRVASEYLESRPGATVVGYSTGRSHLVDESGAALCGSYLSPRNISRQSTRDPHPVLGSGWCYSCLGNALKIMGGKQ